MSSAASRLPPSRRPEVHIATGGVADGLLDQFLQPDAGEVLAHTDLLSVGPLPPLESLGQWRRVREEYLHALDGDTSFSFAAMPRDLLTNAPALGGAHTIVLWIGTGLAEQLLLAWLVQLLRLVDASVSRLRLIQFSGHVPGTGMEIFGVGLLNPDQLAAHPPAVTLSADDLAAVDAAWAALTAPNPERLVTFLASPGAAMPLLRRSLASLLPRFPDATSGLSVWDMALLRHVAERGPTAARVIGFTMGDAMDTGDLVGDGYLFARLRGMASASLAHPLVALSGRELRHARVTLTEAGRAALAGTLNAVEVNGIDDWVAGTHLDSRTGHVWFHRDGSLRR